MQNNAIGLVQDENHPAIRMSADPLTLAVQKIVAEIVAKEIASLGLAIGNVNHFVVATRDRVDALEKGIPPQPQGHVDQSVFDRLIALEDKVGNGYSIDELDEKISDLDSRIDDLESQIDDKVDADSVADAIDLDSIRDEVTNSATNNVLGRLIGAIQNAQD